MKLPRGISGATFTNLLCERLGYRVVGQEGSHILLRSELPHGHRLPVPAHKELRIGTLASLIRMVSNQKDLSRDEVLAALFEL
ncbi:putative periplasmic or secreted lipoprotein [Terriglobus roseus DSM 18391]|uniref:Putative periplasmic or secreted lipoprotein n=1 Tax=Terriglobus roseus (strain DSM 18391 / NRRL B-41598 / KBS 63) TaxID=926566 RepID=I3ZAU5_TERRK|nr:type II toxin-antitoxin system HicA family toxin [Terriglobus roseus]AFL86363.1 putative periplasmic or secreted lipoprotein [Terriglobus roseus DSM 18391]